MQFYWLQLGSVGHINKLLHSLLNNCVRSWVSFSTLYKYALPKHIIQSMAPGGEPTKVNCNYIRANVITFAQM